MPKEKKEKNNNNHQKKQKLFMPHSTCHVCLYKHCSTHTLPRPAPLESWSLSLLPGVLPVVSLPSYAQVILDYQQPMHSFPPHKWHIYVYCQLFESQRYSSLNKFPSLLWLYHSMGVTYCAFLHSCSLADIKIDALFFLSLSPLTCLSWDLVFSCPWSRIYTISYTGYWAFGRD